MRLNDPSHYYMREHKKQVSRESLIEWRDNLHEPMRRHHSEPRLDVKGLQFKPPVTKPLTILTLYYYWQKIRG